MSTFKEHTFLDHKMFQKMFHTTNSGLPDVSFVLVSRNLKDTLLMSETIMMTRSLGLSPWRQSQMSKLCLKMSF